MDSKSNPFFSDATDFTNMLLSGLLDGLNLSDERASSTLESVERSPLAKEVLQQTLPSGSTRNGSCSDAASPSTLCSDDDDIGAAIRANWSSASQELCQEEDGGIVLERLGSNYSRLSSVERSEKISARIDNRRVSTRKPLDEDDGGSPPSSPNSIHLNPDIQQAIKMASITIYQGLVRHVDRYSDSTLKDGNIVLCIDPTRKPLQNELSVKVSADTSVWSDAEGAGTPALMSPSGNLELAVTENEQEGDAVSKTLNPSPQGQLPGDLEAKLGSSHCQELGFLPKDSSPELEPGSDLCKFSCPEFESNLDMRKDSSPELKSGFGLHKDAIQEPELGFDLHKDCTIEPSDQDSGLQAFSPTSPCLDEDNQDVVGVTDEDERRDDDVASKPTSPSLPEEQNADEAADACEAFYLQDEEEADEDAAYKSFSPSPPEGEDADVTAVSTSTCEDSDLERDNMVQDENDLAQEDKESKPLSPSQTEARGTDETTTPISAGQVMDLVEDEVETKDRVSGAISPSPHEERLQDSTPVLSPGQEMDQVQDVQREKETAFKSLSSTPTMEHRDDGTPVLMASCEGLDLEVQKEDDTIVAKSLSQLSSEPQQEQEAVRTPTQISPCRDDFLDEYDGDVELKSLSAREKSAEQHLDAPGSVLENANEDDDPRATTTPDKISRDPLEDAHVTEGGTPSSLRSPSSQEQPSRVSSLSSLEEIVMHKDSGDETQQKKAPLFLEEYFNAAMKKFSNTLLDALISHLESYKDAKTDLPLPVRVKSEKANFDWSQEVGETENAKQDGEKSPTQPSISGFTGQDGPCETLQAGVGPANISGF